MFSPGVQMESEGLPVSADNGHCNAAPTCRNVFQLIKRRSALLNENVLYKFPNGCSLTNMDISEHL